MKSSDNSIATGQNDYLQSSSLGFFTNTFTVSSSEGGVSKSGNGFVIKVYPGITKTVNRLHDIYEEFSFSYLTIIFKQRLH